MKKQFPGTTTDEVHYISCGSGLVAMYVIENGNGTMYFPYTNHLGSIIEAVKDDGTTAAEQSFDAWGRNRNPSDWSYNNIPTVPAWLTGDTPDTNICRSLL